jgi:transcriptional regulator with XRE-family HTH domain
MLETAHQLIGRRVREERVRAGFDNQAEFARELGIDNTKLSRVESGQRRADSVLLQRIADQLGVPMEALLRDPTPELALARQGDADHQAMQAMIDWATALRSDLRTMAAYVGRRPEV